MAVSICDDFCTFQISKVGDVGCPSELVTRGRADSWRSNLLGRSEYVDSWAMQVFLVKNVEQIILKILKSPEK